MDFCTVLVFYLNGKKVEDGNVDPEWTLLYYLRNKKRLCGTKFGCGEGGCGACTVMVSKFDRVKNKLIHIPVNACLAPVLSIHGMAVTTIEGIGSVKSRLHPVQERIAKAHGSQCGFCTPGIVMSMYTLLRNMPKPSMKDMEVAFQGNLCRCTGYRPIIEGYKTFTAEWERNRPHYSNGYTNGNGCAMGEKCCKLQNGTREEETLFKSNKFTPYDPTQEPIFPPELKLTDTFDKQYLLVKGDNVTWYRPTSLEQLINLKHQFPKAKIIVGNTEVGVEVKFKNCEYPVVIHASNILQLVKIQELPTGIKIGASATLANIEDYLKRQILKHPEYKTRIFTEIIEMLHWFASKQIRSVGSIGGNIMTGSPISDLLPLLMATQVKLETISVSNGKKSLTIDDKFFTGYRKSIIQDDEVLVSLTIPFTTEQQYCQAYKQARRREDDIAIVNEAIFVTFKQNSSIIDSINFGFGGMAPTTITAPKTQRALKGQPWSKYILDIAYKNLLDDLPLEASAPGGMVDYRRSLALSLFFKAFLTISNKLSLKLDIREITAIKDFKDCNFNSAQYFTVVPETKDKIDQVHRPIVHLSALKQATGEAEYTDDIPFFENELFLAFVLSTKAHARVVSIDTSEAMKLEGVHGFVSGADLDEEHNTWGIVCKDEKVFFSDTVTAHGQIIAAVVAENELIARKAAKKVKIVYEDLQPVIVTIEDAIQHNSYFGNCGKTLAKGDVEKAFKNAPHVIEGECRIGGQEHFYMETQTCICIPKKEDDEMDIWSATQGPTELADYVAHTLGVQQNKIVAKVKRLGGGFGGKELKSILIALPTAVAARKFNRPVRCVLSRDEDMLMTAGRNPFKFFYKVAFNDEGKLLGCDVKFYVNCGYATDYSLSVADKALTHINNAYIIPALRVSSYPCKTNLPSNTAFRGFGGPQSMFAAETILDDVASYLKKDPDEVRFLNLAKEADITHYNQKLVDCTIQKCWTECVQSSDYNLRKKDVARFNRENRYKKRGLSVVPTMFGIAFAENFLNQAGALVLVYTDGSVLLSHGGTEMGQGLHTKMIQLASKVLDIPMDLIHTSYISTDKVPNTTSTAASCSSDLNGMAILQACETILERLKPYKEKNPQEGWKKWVERAYFDRVSLSATGFYRTPDIGYDWETGKGMIYNYFSYGVACSEVEVDVLTGDHKVIRTDIVMDLGESLNPAIDVGQIEGGFMQGYGLFVMEELCYSPSGQPYTKGPGAYKIPGFNDIPQQFNVSLLKGVSNPRAVYSSKAIGEPPLFLACSVFFAIKEAIKAAREESKTTSSFRLDAPLTSAKIRMACKDRITGQVEKTAKVGTPWNVIV